MFMQMSTIMVALGQHELSLEMQQKALERCCLYRIAGPTLPAIRLLAFMAPGDNMPVDFLVENSDIGLDILFLSADRPLPELIPEHDIAIVAIRETTELSPLLDQIVRMLPTWPRPVLNRPQAIKRCARDLAYEILKDIPGLLIPETRRVERDQIGQVCFPITIRPVDTHGGKGMAKLDNASELNAYLAADRRRCFNLSQYIDYRSDDGLYRKYRIALIDGKPYICHLAISDNWMVHYIAASMQDSPEKRLEEAAAMESFDFDFALRHRAALNEIALRLGLEYVVLDCGEMRDGRLLWFEADNGGWIHAMDPVEIFPYKPKIMQKAFAAFRAMLVEHARPH